MGWKRFAGALAGLALGYVFAAITDPGLAWAQPASKPAPKPAVAATSAAAPQLATPDLDAWLDGFMPYALRRADVAGAVVVVVKDGQVLTQKGYGFADVTRRKPVDPETTLFRPGSISKLFTWTAVMQQVEAGKLDLDADVNRYLDFKIPPYEGRPITLRNLMTHTAGFEEHLKSLFVRNASGLVPLDRFERENLPRRIFPPGQTPAYSNYGAALAGYIVQRVSGEPFEAYVERHIFAPLGMTHASFRQPLPDALAADMSQGYRLGSGPAQYFEFVNPPPAGALSASGGDIARFMIAHLDEGRFGAAQILKPESVAAMHATAFRSTPALNGMTLGFFEADRNGHRVIEHGGDLGFFHSDLYLVLDQKVGLFVSLNSAGVGASDLALRSALYREFMDRYFPAPYVQPPRPASAVADAARITGFYELSRRGQTTVTAALRLAEQMKVTADAKGDIAIPLLDALTGSPHRTWREIAPMVWQEAGGVSKLAAVVRDGRVVALTTDDLPAAAVLQPVPAGLRQSWLLPALAASILVLALTALTWPVAALVRWRYRATYPLSRAAGWLDRSTRAAAVMTLAAVAGWLVVLVYAGSDPSRANPSLDPAMRLMQFLALVAAGLSLGAVANLVLVWRDGTRSWWAKLAGLLIVAALALVFWVELVIRLFSPSLNY